MSQRGMVKWQPFASMPEQMNYVKNLTYRLGKQNRPLLSNEQLIEIGESITCAYNSNQPLTIDYYHDGYLYKYNGTIEKINFVEKYIIVYENSKKKKITFNNIINTYDE